MLREYSEKIRPNGTIVKGDAAIKNAESVNQWLANLAFRKARLFFDAVCGLRQQ